MPATKRHGLPRLARAETKIGICEAVGTKKREPKLIHRTSITDRPACWRNARDVSDAPLPVLLDGFFQPWYGLFFGSLDRFKRREKRSNAV